MTGRRVLAVVAAALAGLLAAGFGPEDLAPLTRPDPLYAVIPGVAFVLAVIRRQLREAPAWVAWGLVAVTALGLALRLAIAPMAPMNAFAFTRVLPLAGMIFEGPALAAIARGRAVYLTDVIAWTNLGLAAVTPLVFFAHARYLLRDPRGALAAAALIALLPMHIRFALSDVQFIASLVTSSFTFLVLYGALTETSARWRALCFALLPLLSLATYLTRPENIIFAALDLGALTLYLRADVPRRRVLLAGALIVAAAAWSVATNLLANFGHNVSSGLSANTLRTALAIAVDPRLNTLVNPSVTPPVVPLLAALGAATLWRGGERGRATFLVGWLGAFFVVHSYVRPHAVAMQARYHLHLVTPLVLLAAASTPLWLRRPRAWVAAPALWMLAAPLLHLNFERDVDFTEMHEAAFLRGQRGRIGSCPVVEFNPAVERHNPSARPGSRVERMTAATRGERRDRNEIVQLGVAPAGGGDEVFAVPDARLADPAPCLFFYEGATCAGFGRDGRPAAPCAEMHRRARLSLVARSTFRWRWYDDAIAGRIEMQPDRSTRVVPLLPEGTPITLSLYRVLPR